MLHEKINLCEALDKAINEQWDSARKFIEIQEKRKQYAELFRRISYFYRCKVYAFGSLILQLDVKSVAESEAALAFIEDECNVTFDKTQDYASATYAERTFKATGLDFQVDVRVKSDSQNCRSVLVGYESVPKYEIQCDEEGK